MSDVSLVRLGDCCEIVSGATPKTGVGEYWGGEIAWATPKDLSNIDSKYIAATPQTLTEAGYRSCSAKIMPAGSVLFSSRAPIGHVAINKVPMCTNQGFKSFVPDPERVSPDYLYHWLSANKAYLQSLGNGATFKEVSKATIVEVKIPLPVLAEQRRIAAILDKADALRAKRREAIAKLDQLLQSVFLDMFGDSDSKDDSAVPLGDAFWFQEGPGVRKWQFTSSGVKLLNVGNIEKDGSINLAKTDRHVSNEEAQGKYKHFLVDEGDLVIASSGVSFDYDGLLRTRGGFIEKEHLPLCMNTSTIRFKAIEGKSSLRYLQAWINSRGFRSQITRLVTGSAQQNFGPSHLRQLRIPLPPLSDQQRFGVIAEHVERQKRSLLKHGEQTHSLFTSLQHRAFTGTL